MKQFNTNENYLITNSNDNFMSAKFLKLNYLLQKSKIKNQTKDLRNSIDFSFQNLQILDEKAETLNFGPNFSLYYSLIEKPLNLLFSIDQFVFEFSKKTYQQKKTGEFFQQLKERKKLSMFYGNLTRKQISNLFNQAKKSKGYFSKNLFSLLERRLDVVVYRSGLTQTIAEARQLIKHKKIYINHQLINVPSVLLNPGDVISFTPKTSFQNSLILEKDENSLSSITEKGKNQLKNKRDRNEKSQFSFISDKAKTNSKFKNFGREKNSEKKNISPIIGDFFFKLKKTLDFSSRISSKNLRSFSSKLLCLLMMKLVCTRINLRAYWNLQKEKIPTNLLNLEISEKGLEKSKLTMLKWKSFSRKKPFSSKKLSSQSINKKTFLSFKRKKSQDRDIYANLKNFSFFMEFLQKKPKIWNRYFSSLRPTNKKKSQFYTHQNSQGRHTPFQNSKIFGSAFLPKFDKNWDKQGLSFTTGKGRSHKNEQLGKQQPQKLIKTLDFKKKNITLYRKSFLLFLKHLENSKKFTNLIILSFRKSLLKKTLSKQKNTQFLKKLNFRRVRPLNIEISYNLLNLIYLFSPQRVNFPFSIDLDLINRSLR